MNGEIVLRPNYNPIPNEFVLIINIFRKRLLNFDLTIKFQMNRDFVRRAEKTAGRVFCLWGEASFFLDFLGTF